MTLVLPLDALRHDPSNARTVHEIESKATVASLRAVGLIQPIVVRPIPDSPGKWFIVAGNRRVAAARELGWETIEAVEFKVDDGENPDDYALAASAAENMVREPMHPVDQWRAMTALMDRGYSLEGAADALGVEHRMAKRLNWLGRMAPPVLEALIERDELPRPGELRAIGSAPHEVQIKALEAARKASKDEDVALDWWRVASACEMPRIPQSRAIFDVATCGIVFEEDLFAQADDADRFTTVDVNGFMNAQHAALGDRIQRGNGRFLLGTWDRDRGAIKPPTGYELTWDTVLQRWRKDDPRRVVLCITPDGYNIGSVVARVAVQKGVVVPPQEPAGDDEAEGFDIPAPAEPERAKRDPISKAVQSRLAAMKGEALREAMPTAFSHDGRTAMSALLLAFCARNVSVSTGTPSGGDLEFVIRRMIEEDGSVKSLSDNDLCDLAIAVVSRVIHFDHPNSNFGTSGSVADWLARFVGAQMPRCDTEEILKGLSGDLIVEVARAHGIDDKGRVADVRKRLIGKCPQWSPVSFRTPGPDPEESHDDYETEQEHSSRVGGSLQGRDGYPVTGVFPEDPYPAPEQEQFADPNEERPAGVGGGVQGPWERAD